MRFTALLWVLGLTAVAGCNFGTDLNSQCDPGYDDDIHSYTTCDGNVMVTMSMSCGKDLGTSRQACSSSEVCTSSGCMTPCTSDSDCPSGLYCPPAVPSPLCQNVLLGTTCDGTWNITCENGYVTDYVDCRATFGSCAGDGITAPGTCTCP